VVFRSEEVTRVPIPKKAVHVETSPLKYCPECLTAAPGALRMMGGEPPRADTFCSSCGARLAVRLVRIVACECAPTRPLVSRVPDPYRVADRELAALHPDNFCPSCGTSVEKLCQEAELLALAAPPPAA
jgi:hypothetical protein